MSRLPALFGSICFVVTYAPYSVGLRVRLRPNDSSRSLVLFLPVRPKYSRNGSNVLVFQIFILYVHYVREVAERRLFTLRDQLKTQFKATQKAQVNERKAADSKRRLTSWVYIMQSLSFGVLMTGIADTSSMIRIQIFLVFE